MAKKDCRNVFKGCGEKGIVCYPETGLHHETALHNSSQTSFGVL